MPEFTDKMISAYHEAGHAVIAWYYNRTIQEISIVQNGETHGEFKAISLFGKVPNLPVHELEKELDLAMAGAAAMEKYTERKMTGTKWGGPDYMQALKIAEKWAKQVGRPLDEGYIADMNIDINGITGCLFSSDFLNEFGKHVRKLMSRPHIWKCVEALASSLVVTNKISGKHATELITQTWDEMDGDSKEQDFNEKNVDDGVRTWGEWGFE